MGEFFHGWRRKAGCVTLGLACVLALEWVRSISEPSDILFWGLPGEELYRVRSEGGEIRVLCTDAIVNPPIYEVYQVEYYRLTIPLTLISTWLLLSKRLKPTQKPSQGSASMGD